MLSFKIKPKTPRCKFKVIQMRTNFLYGSTAACWLFSHSLETFPTLPTITFDLKALLISFSDLSLHSPYSDWLSGQSGWFKCLLKLTCSENFGAGTLINVSSSRPNSAQY